MLVETAQEMLYVNGIRPSAKAISDLLASRSLTPTRVSCLVFLNDFSHLTPISLLFRMHSPSVLQNLVSTFILCLLLICFMSLNSKCGRQHSPTFFGFFTLKGGIVSRNSTKGSLPMFCMIFYDINTLIDIEKSPHLAMTQFASLYTMHQG